METVVGVTLLWGFYGTLLPGASTAQTTQIVESEPENLIWRKLYNPDSEPVLRVESGDRVAMQTISHQGILPDQGETVEFLTEAGIAKENILLATL